MQQSQVDGGRFAVMDLGTNTFHLLIASGSMPKFTSVVHLHEAVKLGEGGINDGIIKPEPFRRGIEAMRLFRQHLDENKVVDYKAIGTSAIRNAKNGTEFIETVKKEANIDIEMIDGNTEANYIYEGVKASASLSKPNSLIMDIGGGSVEFIICNTDGLHWKHSFEVGAARLMDKFHHTDPMRPAAIEAMEIYLEEQLKPLFEVIKLMPVNDLIGSSGAFETFACLIEFDKGHEFKLKETIRYEFDLDELLNITARMINSTHQERAADKNIIPVRVDMIVVASAITRYIIRKLELTKVQMTTFSLKEGVLAGMLMR